MSNNYLDNILQSVSTYQAEYLKTPISERPSTGCVLPNLTSLPSPLVSPILPTTTKTCNPLFVPFPLIPQPSTTPLTENCPSGLTFSIGNQNIVTPALVGTVSTSITPINHITQDGTHFCQYDAAFPDLIIPCYPNGPVFSGSGVQVKVNDTLISTLAITQESGVCQWSLTGDTIDISVPTALCPTGLNYSQQFTNYIIKYPEIDSSTGSTLVTTGTADTLSAGLVRLGSSSTAGSGDACNLIVELPTLTVPCYPTGPVFKGVVQFKLQDGTTLPDSFTLNNETSRVVSDPVHRPCEWNIGTTINLPMPKCDGGISYASTIFVKLNSSTTLTQIKQYRTGYAWNLGQQILDPSGNLQTVTGIVSTGLTGSSMPTWNATIGGTTTDNQVTWTTGTAPSSYSSLDLVEGPNYQSLLHLPLRTGFDCGAGLLGTIELNLPNFVSTCASGLSVGSTHPTITVAFPGDSGYTTGSGFKTFGLTADTCGFEFNGGVLSLPIINWPCSSGYAVTKNSTTASSITVDVKDSGGNIISQTSALTLTPADCSFDASHYITVPMGCASTYTTTSPIVVKDTSGATVTQAGGGLTLTPTGCGINVSGYLTAPLGGGGSGGSSVWI